MQYIYISTISISHWYSQGHYFRSLPSDSDSSPAPRLFHSLLPRRLLPLSYVRFGGRVRRENRLCRGSRIDAISLCFLLIKRTMASKEAEGYQWCRSSVDELMLRASRHNHKVSSFDILVFTGNGSFTYAGSKGQGLVDGVNLEEIAVSLWSRYNRGIQNGPHLRYPHQQAQS